MRPKERRPEILALVNRLGLVTVEDLSEKLGVSRETVRRDLTALEATGSIRKYHGGARALDNRSVSDDVESPFDQRMIHNTDGKRAIAEATSQLFQRGDTIFIDTGSTTLAVAESLSRIPSLLVITNSPKIAAIIAGNGSSKVFLIGGAYGVEPAESLGPLALEQIAKFRAQHAILTVGAIDTAGVMNFDLQEAEVARAIIDRVETVTVVADHTKFGRRAVFEVAPLSRISRIITDKTPVKEICNAIDAAGALLIVAE